jgi:hypothetical protein
MRSLLISLLNYSSDFGKICLKNFDIFRPNSRLYDFSHPWPARKNPSQRSKNEKASPKIKVNNTQMA